MKPAPAVIGDSTGLEEIILGFDWSTTPLGSPAEWPQSLRSIVALILASGKPMFVVWGAVRTLIYNDAYVPLLGQKHPAALGMPFFSVWPEAEQGVAPLFDRLFGGTVVDLDDISISFDREDGSSESHFAPSYTPIRDRGNRVVGLLCIHSETAQPSPVKLPGPRDGRRLAQIFEQAPSFIAILNGPEHRIELANAGFSQLVGDLELVGRPFTEALPEPRNRHSPVLLDHAFASGERVVDLGVRYPVPASHGEAARERFVDFVFQPITNGIGQVTGIFVHGADVTERVHHATELRDRETHLHEENVDLGRLVTERSAQLEAKEALIQTVYEHSSEYHAVVTQIEGGDFRLEEINPAALRLYNASRQEVIGRRIDECLGAEEARLAGSRLAECLRTNVPQAYEFRYRDAIIEGVASPLPPTSGVGRQIAVSARDVTARRNLEEQLRQSQKMEAVGQLTGGLAHDFNNLLAAIAGSLELMKVRITQGRSAEIDRYVTAIQGATQRAAALTQRLLAFSRRQTLDAKAIDVDKLIAGMNDLVRRTVGPAIQVALMGTGNLWNALADPNQLEHALLNLCINARDAMPDGGKLSIETGNHVFDGKAAAEDELPPGQYISLSVSDTGIGMPPEIMQRAFEPFFTTKPIGSGTGLGLSMIYGFARQSGGRVQIRSEVGRGTTVCIYLPRYAGAAAEAETAVDLPEPHPARQGETVLIVDDEPTVRMLMSEVVRDMGYTAIEAKDAAEALTVIHTNRRIDLLIADIGLPGGMDGRRLGEAARARRTDLQVLFITGYPAGAGGEANAQVLPSVLTKPFAMRELALRINALMSAQ